MLAILSTIIGIVFVMLLFSMLASTIMELLAGYLSLRGQQLVKAIKGMVGHEASIDFIDHPFFQQLSAGSRERTRVGGKKRALPSYISAGTFSSILMDIMKIDSEADVQAKIDGLPDGASKKLAQFLYKQSNGQLVDLKGKVEHWYSEVMDRSSGAYKRTAQRWLIGIGLAVAVVFNVDVINIYHNLSINATLSNTIADAATNFVNTQPAPTAMNLENPDISEAQQKIGQLVNENIAALESPLGLGWDNVDWNQVDVKWWLYKIIGWITTALGISLGATFWFEALKKLVSLRASGPPPASPAVTTTTITQTTPSTAQASISSGGALTQPEPAGMFESFKRESAAPPKKTRGAKKDAEKDQPPK
ncbi:MAG: hypothetical protein KDC65_05635 [Saprospiraceae bacterium]|nr:hypothetical protein [Saprospiraceae bacterium]